MTLSAGARLGPYEIVAPIGAGGMGEVYRGRDTRLERAVAIKVLPSEFASNAQLRLRFEREAKTISQLNHPNICALYDVGDDGGTPYLVMELLDGQTLAARIARGPLALADVLTYGIQIAEALNRAHREGIVHRDLKPGNVMLTRSGAKLLDFGLAKSASVLASPDGQTEHKPLTAEGMIIGTFQYMAPEQLEGAEAGARTDIFALGSVLYEMATGKPAFEGKTRTSLIAAIVSSNPAPLSQVQPLTPPALEHVVVKCLEKDPDARWQSAHDIAEHLRWIRDRATASERERAARPRSREGAAWALAVVALIVAALLGWREWQQRRDAKPQFLGINAPEGETFDFAFSGSGALTVSPNGRYVTFDAADSSGLRRLWIRAIDSDKAVAVPDSGGEDFPFWSPDSRSIAFFNAGKLKRMDINGSAPVVICDAPTGRSGGWNQDGVIIFSPTATGPIHRVSASGGQSVAVTTVDVARHESTHRWATFLPDGRHFLYLTATHSGASTNPVNAIFAGSIDGGVRKQIVQAPSNVSYANGRLFYLRDRALVAQEFDPQRLELRGDPYVIAQGATYEPGLWRSAFSVSDNGTLVYERGGQQNAALLWFDRKGTMLGTSGTADNYHFIQLSPDDSTAAVVIDNEGTGTSDIWLHDFTRVLNQRFTFGNVDESWPVWSPDGKMIAFSDSRQSTDGLWMKPVDGSSGERLLSHSPDFETEPSDWSPDGKYIVTTRHRPDKPTEPDVFVVPVDGSEKPFLFRPNGFSAQAGAFSPDGKWLSYISKEAGRYDVFIARFPSGASAQQVSTDGARFVAAWRGDQIFWGSTAGKIMTASVMPSGSSLSIGVPKTVPIDMPVALTFAHRSERMLAAVQPHRADEISVVMNWPLLLKR